MMAEGRTAETDSSSCVLVSRDDAMGDERPPRSPCLGGRMSPDRLVGAFVVRPARTYSNG